MFSTRNVLVAAAILAAAPAPALLAQQGTGGYPQGGQEQHEGRGGSGQRGERGQRRMGSPVQRLIEHSEELSLSTDQVARLQRIDQALQSQTQPLRQQLEQYRPAGGQFGRGQGQGQDAGAQRAEPSDADRQAMRQRMEQARPVMEQLRKANDAALQQAFQVLSADQRKQAESLMPRRGERGDGREGGRRGGQGGGGQGWNRAGGTR